MQPRPCTKQERTISQYLVMPETRSESVSSQPKMEAGGQAQMQVARARMPEPEPSENVRASGAGRGGGRWRRVPAQPCPNGEMEVSYESRTPHGDQLIVRLATNLIAVDFRSRPLACPLLGHI
jgi:hypothetical protein